MNAQAPKLKVMSVKENRRDFYSIFINLMENGFAIEAYLLMLSIWNFARFRYAVRSFNLDHFEKQLKKIEPLYKKLDKEDFRTIKFDKYSKEIIEIFNILSQIKGIEKTGAPKLMHLKVPKVFVMWDTYIRKEYKFKKGDAFDYLAFLKLMQEKFGKCRSNGKRTLAKLVDEHNYNLYTAPVLSKNK